MIDRNSRTEMEPKSGRGFQFDWKIGPASILALAQLAVMIFFAASFVWRVGDGIDAIKAHQHQQDMIIERAQATAEITGNRLTRVETEIGGMKGSLERIERNVYKP